MEWEVKKVKKKCILSGAFLVSLLPMLLNQYGGLKGVQEITGLINLFNPIGIASVLLFFTAIWYPYQKQGIGKILGALGVSGIVISEIYKFLTWHVMTITGEISIQHSMRFAFPEFYFGFGVSLGMVVLYFVINRKYNESVSK